MNKEIENIIKKNLPEKKEAGLYTTSKATGGDIINYNREDNDDKREGFNQALSQINTSLIADEVLKITKCDCCDENDEHIYKDDRSTTRISRPCSGCGKHQTIAGALLKSKEWQEWYKYASENMLFDVDETLTVDAMSDEHWNSFMKFLNDEVLKVVVETINQVPTEFPQYENDDIDVGAKKFKTILLSNLSPNKENKNNERNV